MPSPCRDPFGSFTFEVMLLLLKIMPRWNGYTYRCSRPATMWSNRDHMGKMKGNLLLTIDFQNSRLYWTCAGSNKVQSSDIQGRDIQIVIQRATHSGPNGIGLSGDRIFWSDFESNMLESGTKSGEDVNILYGGASPLYGLALAPSRGNLVGNRTNHCENRACSKVCVLTPTSFSCLY